MRMSGEQLQRLVSKQSLTIVGSRYFASKAVERTTGDEMRGIISGSGAGAGVGEPMDQSPIGLSPSLNWGPQ